MFSQVYLAVSPQEMAVYRPMRMAYMACHFSASGTGLSNLPAQLPGGSLLLVDDSTPVQGHDPKEVVLQLQFLVEQFSIKAVLLDFQREKTGESAAMAGAIANGISCAAVTAEYADGLPCPVFLPPPPVNMALQDYLAPWKKRGVYLEIAPEAVQFTVTRQGCKRSVLLLGNSLPLADVRLHCHYGVRVLEDRAVFSLERTREDLAALVQEADVLGLVGLYAELR